jgi:hypothetical protein
MYRPLLTPLFQLSLKFHHLCVDEESGIPTLACTDRPPAGAGARPHQLQELGQHKRGSLIPILQSVRM